ncbi:MULTISPECIES: GGDEF domain-containing protein [Comamonas]|uniref:diguanylate cyclase n=2 Tax=Comamonas thiooxydans TaxID=363952 RepID=A0A5M3M3S8_9BURK|nr:MULTISPECIES: GGDEF domain-containing protein [Comamonas]EFI62755.1 diguanylate cyclase with PAS/PAC sensor [Comamonas thiooxydans]KKI13066.1 diguanylate cyclase [Comamonas thiooxydans]MDH1333926.1 GGDEF domain-containing protein [Comamonas thiooxydans]MDH1473156.1 GGDEF domain-containing protein [Comamonas thiooxydans]MDH1740152.1 GGDEF domain-containing protein [Comamonas thiooxydans]
MAFITWAYASGWSQTQSDPGLFFWHQLVSVTGVLGLLVAAPQVAFQALVMLLVFSTDGFLAPRRTSFWMTWSCTLIAIALAVYWAGPQMRMTTDTLIGQFLTVGVMLGAVVRCSVLVTYFRGMQYRLSASNEKLALALKQIENLVRNDDLTGLANRRGVMDRLQQCIHAAQRRDAPFCIALLDIDFFKQVNDRYGHEGGDQVLRAFGQLLSSQIRATDCAGRYGGEEFLLVLCDTPLAQAGVLLERIRESTEALPWTQLVHKDLRVTCTLGVTQYRQGETAEALISRADAAMYRGKAAGRNRVVLA